MSKIGTAHIEIKPVLNEEALAEVATRIKDVIERAVADAFSGDAMTDLDRALAPFNRHQ